ncbi:MAG TPA: hypothetical protein VLL51_04210, partial [Gemmatimonadales bacterium]|nr:hypothetical protein [Gemmatimonadales bacterium]
WVYSMEFARLATLLVVCAVLLALDRFPPVTVVAVAAFGLVSLAWLARLRPVVKAEPLSA